MAAAALVSGCASPGANGAAAAPTDSKVQSFDATAQVPSTPERDISGAAPTSQSANGASLNSRGNHESELGSREGFIYSSNGASVFFTVNAITVDVPCTEAFAPDADNGHLIAVDMTVTTPSSLQDRTSVSARDFSVLGPDGTTETELVTIATFGCLGSSAQLTSGALGPGQTYNGVVLLDSPVATGALIYAPGGLDASGWEWQF